MRAKNKPRFNLAHIETLSEKRYFRSSSSGAGKSGCKSKFWIGWESGFNVEQFVFSRHCLPSFEAQN